MMYAIYENLKKEVQSISNDTEKEVLYIAFKTLAHWANLEGDESLFQELLKVRDSLR